MTYLPLILLGVLLNAAAQLFLKEGMRRIGHSSTKRLAAGSAAEDPDSVPLTTSLCGPGRKRSSAALDGELNMVPTPCVAQSTVFPSAPSFGQSTRADRSVSANATSPEVFG